jgi:hypothetical protein
VAWGLAANTIVMFDESPAFRVGPVGRSLRTHPAGGLVRHGVSAPERLGLGTDVPRGWRRRATANLGRGTVYLFGPEITYRAQPHGTFKFLFNAIMKP